MNILFYFVKLKHLRAASSTKSVFHDILDSFLNLPSNLFTVILLKIETHDTLPSFAKKKDSFKGRI